MVFTEEWGRGGSCAIQKAVVYLIEIMVFHHFGGPNTCLYDYISKGKRLF